MLDPAVDSAIRARFSNARFSGWIGAELVSLGEGSSEIRLPLQPHHLNPGGIAHGGIVASLLDMAIGLAHRTKLAPDASHLTLHLDVSYLRPARGTIVARANVVRSGERVGFGEATLHDESGGVLARGSAAFLVVTGPLDGE